jgi:arylsulfatase A-like enzyme
MSPEQRPCLRALSASGALALAVACGAAPDEAPANPTPPPPSEPRPNILIIDIDSLRADRVGASRDGEPITPSIDALAARGVVFEQAITQGGWTMPGLAAILTGRYPSYPVGPQAEELALSWRAPGSTGLEEILGWYGYTTVFCGGNTLAGAAGSDAFQQSICTEGRVPEPVGPLVRWLEAGPPEPFFVLLHDLDLHKPALGKDTESACAWALEPDVCDIVAGKGPSAAYDLLVGSFGAAGARERVSALYDGVLHSYDAALAGLFDTLQQRGLAEDTVIVLVSNHGEELGEHGSYAHGVHYDTVLRVPLVMVHPGSLEPGRRVADQVETVDLTPTLLQLAGIPVERRMDGRSLLGLLEGDGGYVMRAAYSLTDASTASVRWPTRKIWIAGCPPPQRCEPGPPRDGSKPKVWIEHYDLGNDPSEQEDLARGRSLGIEAPLGALERWLRQRPLQGHGEGGSRRSDQALRERLQQDGYWHHVQQGEEPAGSAP